ncbi:MAG: PAS domain S-box protein [Cyclobacteriaceae bacterium]
MKTSDITKKEQERLAALYSCQILDTESDAMYDNITAFAANLCETPVALITFVDDDRLWVKSSFGLEQKVLPKNNSFCALAIEENALFEVTDAETDRRFKHSQQVAEQGAAFYAGVPLLDAEGHALGTICVLDTEPRKLTDKQKNGLELFASQVSDMLIMHRTKVRYETLIESSRDMIYELDEKGKFLFANKSTITKTGYSLEKLQTMNCWDLIQDDTREKVKAHYINQIKEGKSSIYHEFPIEDKEGNTIWLGQSVDYIFTNGRVSKAYVIAKDVTELVRTRLMLKESEEQILAEKNILNMMVFSSPAAIAMFSKDFKYLAFSEKWNINQHINEQIIGLNSDGKLPEQTELLDSIKEKIMRGETVGKENDLVVSEDGDERWIQWVATPWSNTTDGSVGGIIVYANDITHVIKHEAELQKAYEQAEKSSKIKEDFLSSMSHEIRTPLNAIIGTANLLMEENEELAKDEKFQLLKFSSNNLLSLINNVLDFSKIESGNIHLESGDFEIGTLTESLVNSWRPLASEKGIDLILECDESIPNVVKGDSVRLGQVLNNLVNNALKFTEKGFVQVKIEQCEEDNVHFEIQDTGIGIPTEKLDTVFESFKQVTSHLTHQHGGTGLGLPICQNLVRMMGSELELNSQEGFGSKFSFTIKLEKGDESKVASAVESKENKQLDIHVLLVEDNTANQFIAKSFLEKWGVTLQVASNGLEALDHIKSQSFDLVLLDIRMPVMDGYTCAKRIRTMEGDYFHNVPIIALTASTILDIRKNGSVLEFDDFLSKPFEPKKLYSMLIKHANVVLELDQPMVDETSGEDADKVFADTRQDEITQSLNAYTEGDEDFLAEFTENIILNLVKIRSQIPQALIERDKEALGDLVHMVKPTIEIIGQEDLMKALNDLKTGWKRERIDEPGLLEVLRLVDEKIEILHTILAGAKTKEFAGL